MKKILLIIAFLAILIAIPLTVFLVRQSQEIRQRAAKSTSLFFSPAQVNVAAGEEFDIDIQMETGQNQVAGVQINLTFAATYLQIISLQPAGNFPLTAPYPAQIADGTGSLVLTAPTTGGGTNIAQGTGTIARARFRALASTNSTATPINIGTSQVSGVDDPGRNLLVGSQPANVTIDETTGASPGPSSTPTGQASPSPSSGTTSPSPSATINPSPSPSGGTGGADPSPSPTSTTASPSSSATASTTSPSPSSSSSSQVTRITAPAANATVTSARPTISGTTFANGLVILSIGNTSITTTFYADASGNWSYTPTTNLANGTYTATVTGDDIGSGSAPETATVTFTVSAGGTGGTGTVSPTPRVSASTTAGTGGTSTTSTSTSSAIPVTADTHPTMLLFALALSLIAVGSFSTVFFRK